MTREKAIKIVQSATVWTDEERDALAMLIPELAESEDEKIRKELVAFFKAMQDSPWHEEYWHDLEIVRILAYLEKQKDEEGYEEIPVESTLEYKLGFKAGKDSEKQKEQKPAEWSEDIIQKAVKEVGLTQHQINWFKTNVFPPKQEWSEEDEDNLCRIIRVLEDNDSDWKELSNWLKSLRPSWKPSEEQMKALNEIVNILAASPFFHQND